MEWHCPASRIGGLSFLTGRSHSNPALYREMMPLVLPRGQFGAENEFSTSTYCARNPCDLRLVGPALAQDLNPELEAFRRSRM